MLTKRQKQILTILDMNQQTYMNGKNLASQVGCSVKTLQTDMKIMRHEMLKSGVDIISVPSKGYILEIHDLEQYNHYKQKELQNDSTCDFNDQSSRIAYILNRLFTCPSYIKSEQLADEMFVSRSCLSVDMKIVKKILEKYDLTLDARPNYGIKVSGFEQNMRECITKEQIALTSGTLLVEKNQLSLITNIIVETLMASKYRISDVVLQNLVIHVSVSIQRIKKGIYIEDVPYHERGQESVIAKKILEKLAKVFDFEVKKSEISFLATHLLGKKNYGEDDVISQEVDLFVNGILDEIKQKTNIDFAGDVELRISLALHIAPLLVRLRNRMQLKNNLVKDIQVNYPLAYDVALIAAAYISQKIHVSLDEDEVGYLAVHFSLALSKKEKKINPKKVLIICSARRGDYLMMQHMFMQEFSEMISKLDIKNAIELPECDLSQYDCIFTTFLNHPFIPKKALRINFFIDEKDKVRIDHALKGNDESSQLLKYFQEDYFMGVIHAKNKKEVIRQMCQYASQLSQFNDDLYESCLRRKFLGSTAYGHCIALPHPDSLISQKTFVMTAILDKSIEWSHQKVQLIFLICVEKGNQKDLRVLFEHIAKLMLNDNYIQTIIEQKSYQALTDILGKILKGE